MEDILSHPHGPLPCALSTSDGLLRKTNKASSATNLQKGVAVAEEHLENYASILDGMNFVERVKCDQATFGDIASAIFFMALKEGSHSKQQTN